jgi:predicted TIM-barrel fold metal-dependent hydrolase
MPEVAENLKHVVYDTAACIWLYRDDIHDIARRLCGGHKILFGSDYPLTKPSRYYTDAMQNLEAAYRRRILGENAVNFFELPVSGSVFG